MTADSSIALWLFTTDVCMGRAARDVGVDALVVDWEWRGKEERQVGVDTEINRDTSRDLDRLRAIAGVRVVCRINATGAWTEGEVEEALSHGATDLLLPMVREPTEVERYLNVVRGRARAGILVETIHACSCASDLASIGPDMVYVGLNDLAIARGDRTIFQAMADGTVERLRHQFAAIPFGFGGLTVVDGGYPIPCYYLLAEMERLDCSFSFLRRSFKRDIAGRDLALEVGRLRSTWIELHKRDPDRIERDRCRLADLIHRHIAVPETL